MLGMILLKWFEEADYHDVCLAASIVPPLVFGVVVCKIVPPPLLFRVPDAADATDDVADDARARLFDGNANSNRLFTTMSTDANARICAEMASKRPHNPARRALGCIDPLL